jgi:excisionase family DNA binding protein
LDSGLHRVGTERGLAVSGVVRQDRSASPNVLGELVELVAERAAELVAERLLAQDHAEGWIGVEEAAEYLACPKSRLYALVSARRIPYCKDGSRTLFKRSELDSWVQAGGACRP